jgi:hypothetical protein
MVGNYLKEEIDQVASDHCSFRSRDCRHRLFDDDFE